MHICITRGTVQVPAIAKKPLQKGTYFFGDLWSGTTYGRCVFLLRKTRWLKNTALLTFLWSVLNPFNAFPQKPKYQ